jgi:hypothetical protein
VYGKDSVLNIGAEGKPGVALYSLPFAAGLALEQKNSSRFPALLAHISALGTHLGVGGNVFNIDEKGKALLSLSDKEGHLRAVLGPTSLETVKTGATEETAPGSLTLFDKEGKVIWQAP